MNDLIERDHEENEVLASFNNACNPSRLFATNNAILGTSDIHVNRGRPLLRRHGNEQISNASSLVKTILRNWLE